MHNNSSTERFAVTVNAQNTLQHFQGGESAMCVYADVGTVYIHSEP